MTLNIVQYTLQDFGGAGNAAYRLHKGLQKSGIQSSMLILNKRSGDPSVKVLLGQQPERSITAGEPLAFASPVWKDQMSRWKKLMCNYPAAPPGYEMFTDTVSPINLSTIQEIQSADIINFHWMAGALDFAGAPESLKSKPVVWTLHDMNPFTGGCHYASECRNYLTGCGRCPQLGSQTEQDLSRKCWEQKAAAYKSLNLHIVTLCTWMTACVRESPLLSSFPVHCIPNGFPLDIFRPYPKAEVRKIFGVDPSAKVILFGADSVINERKGFRYLLSALNTIPATLNGSSLILAFFGKSPDIGMIQARHPLHNFGPISDENTLARIYSCADVFVLPSLEDNLPNTAIEAQACGIPTVGFDTGGIPDIIEHRKTGYLAPLKNIEELKMGILWCLSENANHEEIRNNCIEHARRNYSYAQQSSGYQKLYEKILAKETHTPPLATAAESDIQKKAMPLSEFLQTITELVEGNKLRDAISVYEQFRGQIPDSAQIIEFDNLINKLRAIYRRT